MLKNQEIKTIDRGKKNCREKNAMKTNVRVPVETALTTLGKISR
jgi:hypothetical protein